MAKGYVSQADKDADAWIFASAKAGYPQAGHIRATGSVDDLHEARKTMRRAMNAVRAGIGAEPSDEDTAAITHAGQVIAKLSAAIDGLDARNEQLTNSATSGAKIMRNSADFNRHYRVDNNDQDGGDLNLVDFMRGVANMTTTSAVRNALSVGTDANGGFAVPGRLMPGILSALVPNSALLQAGAGIVTLEEGAKTYTTAAVNAIPTAAWRQEAGNLATSEPTFRAITATPRSLAFTFKVSRELLADAEGMMDALYQVIGQAFAAKLDLAGLRGSGTAPEPRGLLNTAGVVSVTNGAAGAAITDYSNIFSATAAILNVDGYMPTSAIMSPRSLVKFASLADTQKQPMRRPQMFESMNFISSSQIPNNLTVTTSSDCSEIYVGDFTKMYFAMRESVSIQVLKELYAGTGEVGFACHVRADVVIPYANCFALVTGVKGT